MLADRFDRALHALQAQTTARQSAGAARDARIATQYPLMNAAFVTMATDVTGSHPRLTLTTSTTTDTYTSHTFPSLDKTIVRVRSTLYDVPETLTFTPALESVAPRQFGVIRVTTDGFVTAPAAATLPEPFGMLLERGVHMYDLEHPVLAIPEPSGYRVLTAALLEEFLAAMLVRPLGGDVP